MENGLSVAEKIVAMLMILGSIVGTLVTAIGTARRAKEESRAKIEKEKQELKSHLEAKEIEKEVKKVELANQLRAFYDKLLEEMDEKYRSSEDEIAKLRISLKTVQEGINKNSEELEGVKKELSKVKKEKETLRDAGLLLIRAIEESIISRDPDCLDPVHVNTNVLKTLNEVKTLFENGVTKG